MTELARQIKIHAAMIVQRVAELPDYNSPEDRPNEMTCTDSELMYIAETQLEAFAEQSASSSLLPVPATAKLSYWDKGTVECSLCSGRIMYGIRPLFCANCGVTFTSWDSSEAEEFEAVLPVGESTRETK